jgi:hypothetical protein
VGAKALAIALVMAFVSGICLGDPPCPKRGMSDYSATAVTKRFAFLRNSSSHATKRSGTVTAIA